MILALLPGLVGPLSAADPDRTAISTGDTAPTLQQVEANRKSVESDTALDETTRQRVISQYDQLVQWLAQLKDARQQLDQFNTLLKDAPARLKVLRSNKKKLNTNSQDIKDLLASGTPEAAEQLLAQEQQVLQSLRDKQRSATDNLATLLVGNKALREDIANKQKLLEQINAELKALAGNAPAALELARKLVLKARLKLRQTEAELLNLRLANQDLLTNLGQAERDYGAAAISAHQSRLELLSNAAQKLREERARKARQQAEAVTLQAGDQPKPLQDIAKTSSQYRLELENLLVREQTVFRDLQTARTSLEGIKSDYDRTRQRVEVVGASQVIGRLLTKRRAELPSPQSYRRTSARRADEIGRATDRQIEIDELLREQSDLPTVLKSILSQLPEARRANLKPQLGKLVLARRDALNELQKAYGRYIGQITSLDLANRQLVEVASSYIEYINTQLIWIPGPGISSLVDPVRLARAIGWFLSPDHWLELVQDAWAAAQSRPLPVGLLLIVFGLLLKWRKSALARLAALSAETRMIRTDSFKLTLLAIWHTLISVGAWPWLSFGVGWLLLKYPTAGVFTLAMANGLVKAAILLFSVHFLIQISRDHGLGDRHLRWPLPVREALIRNFSWILPIALPLAFMTAATSITELPQATQLLGRIAFILLMAVSTLLVYRLLRRESPLMTALATETGKSTLLQLHFIWFPLFIMMPVAFAISSASGYHAAAMHLEFRVAQTFWFFVALFLLKELLLRSLFIAERKLRLDDAVRRRDEIRAQRAQLDTEHEDELPAVSLDIPELNFDQLSDQTRRLVQAGFLFSAVIGIWGIWSDLLPALSFLTSTDLPLHASRIVDGVSQEVPITLGDLAIGLAMVIITILASKNIPGVLEIALLQRLPLDPGARYAITSLSQYAIAGLGVFLAFSTLGLQWSSIQWLVAALSVGLGFGLQEIVANFISGIILLFERPIRVGDVVTIDNITGKVARIRIRATTIINWEKQELLIPNKEFITGRVINWTLTDKVNRVVVMVGVAYGSDVDLAMQLMLEAAAENTEVINDPPPIATFEGFGDNALTLQLRSYLGSMDNRLATITALHRAINEKFNANGLNIAFPQRDLHINTTDPLDVRIHEAR